MPDSTNYTKVYNVLQRLRQKIIDESNLNFSRWTALGCTVSGSTASSQTATVARATKATQDGNGNNIANTYVTKTYANSNYMPKTSGTLTGTTTFDKTDLTSVDAEKVYPVINFKIPLTSGSSQQFTPIGFVGHTATGDQTIVFGSPNGGTVLNAGECFARGKTLFDGSTTAGISGTNSGDSLFLTSDRSIYFYVWGQKSGGNTDPQYDNVLTLTSDNSANATAIFNGSLKNSGTVNWTITSAGTADFKNTKITGTLSTTGAATLASASVTGALTVGGNLTVNGATTTLKATKINGTISNAGDTENWSITSGGVAKLKGTTITGTLSTSGNTTVGGTLTAGGATTINGNLTVSGAYTSTLGGNVRQAASNSAWTITSSGDVTAKSFNATSDERLKTDLEEKQFSGAELAEVNTYYYRFKDSDQKRFGLLAQEIEKILPEAVQENEEGYKSIDYPMVTAMLLSIVKQQEARINAITDVLNLVAEELWPKVDDPT